MTHAERIEWILRQAREIAVWAADYGIVLEAREHFNMAAQTREEENGTVER